MFQKKAINRLSIYRLGESLLVYMLAIFMMSSCNIKSEYHHFCSIPNRVWNKCDTLLYQPINLENTTIKIAIDVRNTSKYRYENLILLIEHNLIDSTKIVRDTIALVLANNSGIWIGDGWGDIRQTTHPYKTYTKTDLNGNSFIRITHLMPDSILIGIEDLGVHITH